MHFTRGGASRGQLRFYTNLASLRKLRRVRPSLFGFRQSLAHFQTPIRTPGAARSTVCLATAEPNPPDETARNHEPFTNTQETIIMKTLIPSAKHSRLVTAAIFGALAFGC